MAEAFLEMGRPPRVLIFTTINWAATAQLGLALTSQGFEVATVAPRNHGIRKVTAIKAHYRSVSYSATASFVASVVERWSPDMVIPCDDLATYYLHEIHAKAVRGDGRDPVTIKAVVENSLGHPTSYPIARKKSAFMAFAKGAGLAVPETATINNPKDLIDRLETSSFPLALKLDSTSSGLGVRIVNNACEAKRAYRDLVKMFGWLRAWKRALKELSIVPLARHWKDQIPSISMQRYVAGTPANRAVLCWRGEVLAGLSVEAIRTAHATGPATVVRILDNILMAETSRHVVRCLGLSGFVGFDFILDETSARPLLIEMNPRATPICHFSFDSQSNMTGALFTKLTDGKARKSSVRPPGKIIALFPGEFWRDPKSDYLLSSHHDVPWEEPQLIKTYARPMSSYSLSWISKRSSQLIEMLHSRRVLR